MGQCRWGEEMCRNFLLSFCLHKTPLNPTIAYTEIAGGIGCHAVLITYFFQNVLYSLAQNVPGGEQ